MKDCELVEELIPLYLEDMLGETAAGFVKSHMMHCAGCRQLYERLAQTGKAVLQDKPLPAEKEKSVKRIVQGYRKWFYTIISVAVIFSLLGGMIGTYTIMKYEELVPNHIAQDFVKYSLYGDRWVYQERMSQVLKDRLPMDKYTEIRNWEEFEKASQNVAPSGFKVYKNVTAQEYGPFDVSLRVGLVLEKDGFRVFKISINDKAEYLKKKATLEKAVENKNATGNNEAITEIDKKYINFPPLDPVQGEFIIEGRILNISGNKIEIEQHMDTHSVPVDSFTISDNTIIARHHIVKDRDYYRKIEQSELKVGDVIFVIFTKDKVPRVVSVV